MRLTPFSARRSRMKSAVSFPMPDLLPRPLPSKTRELAEVNQGKAGLLVLLTAQMCGRLGQHDLERRPDLPFEQVPADRGSIALAQDRMRVHVPAAGFERHVPVDREHFDLLVHADRLVPLRLGIEVGNDRAPECADRREIGGIELTVIGEGAEARHRLVVRFEHERERARAAGFVQQRRLHGRRTARRGPARKPASSSSGMISVSPTGSPSKRSTASRFAPPAFTCSTSAPSAARSQSSSGSRSGTSDRPPRSTNSAASPPSSTTCAPATRAARAPARFGHGIAAPYGCAGSAAARTSGSFSSSSRGRNSRSRSTAPGSANCAPPSPSTKYPRRQTPSVSSARRSEYTAP